MTTITAAATIKNWKAVLSEYNKFENTNNIAIKNVFDAMPVLIYIKA